MFKKWEIYILQEVEAVLFAVTSIAESVDIDEFLYLPTLFRHLSQIPCHNYLVVSQALYMIGECVCVCRGGGGGSTALENWNAAWAMDPASGA